MNTCARDILKNLKIYRENVEKCGTEMRKIRRDLISLKDNCDAGRVVGTGLTTAGTAVMTIAVFTGPIGLAVGATFLGLSIAGAATSITTEVIDTSKVKKIQSEIWSDLSMLEKKTKLFETQAEFLADAIFERMLNYRLNFKDAVEIILACNAELSLMKKPLTEQEMERLKNLEHQKYEDLLSFLLELKMREKRYSACQKMLNCSSGGVAGIAAGTASSVFKQIGKTGARRALSRAAVGVGVFVNAIEIGSLVATLSNDHPALSTIEEILKKLDEMLNELNRVISDLNSAYENAMRNENED